MMRPEPEMRRNLPLAVSMGDPAGIGIEVALKAWMVRDNAGLAPFALYADPSLVAARARALGLEVPVETAASPTLVETIFAEALPVRPIPLAAPVRAGTPNAANAGAVISAIESAVAAVAAGDASALVTCPIAKHVLTARGFAYPGHTEFLAALAEQHFPGGPFRSVMMLASGGFRVVPLTVHCALVDVPNAVTRDRIGGTLRIIDAAMRRDFAVARPRIAVTGLNPHAGEAGSMGREEIDVIAPAITEARAAGLDVTGPYPADTLFHEAARATYDVALCMYHDQALIPFKTVAFEEGVNVTLGLPFVRTSPDHGTAFDIAAEGRASPASFIESLKLAARIAATRAKAAAQG